MSTDTVIPPRPAFWKWGITGLLLLATTINYMDRVALASASVRVTTELGLSDVQYGNLELAFGWAFAIGSLTFGFLADRCSVYWLYPAVLASWSLMGMATGWSNGFTELLVCRALLGFFEAGHWPCALKTTFALLDEKERTMGNSILQSGASIGAIITPQIMKLLITEESGSWRSTFVAVGATGFVWVLAWFLALRSRDLAQNSAAKADTNAPTLFTILRSGRLWAVAILVIGMQIVWHTYRVWLMKFLQIGRGYEESVALDFNSLYFLATDVGCILAGVGSLWLVRRWGSTPHNARRTVFACSCALTSTSLFLPWLGQGWPLLGTLLLIGAGALAMAPCYYSFVQELSMSHVGRMTGLLGLWVWAVTSPMHSLFGMLADISKSYDMVLVVAGVAPWIGVLSMKFLWNRDSVDTIQVSA
ncbi:MFS transporter [Schlesneria sp. DSM 10557]|uniref:MFS transporter n=1 Tax=Schlesneria sp. DSM 10557 TaxID=3044399 RepID=UPI00359F5EBB